MLLLPHAVNQTAVATAVTKMRCMVSSRQLTMMMQRPPVHGTVPQQSLLVMQTCP